MIGSERGVKGNKDGNRNRVRSRCRASRRRTNDAPRRYRPRWVRVRRAPLSTRPHHPKARSQTLLARLSSSHSRRNSRPKYRVRSEIRDVLDSIFGASSSRDIVIYKSFLFQILLWRKLGNMKRKNFILAAM